MRAMNQNTYRAKIDQLNMSVIDRSTCPVKIKRKSVKIMLDFSESTVYDADNQTREGGYY